MRALLPRIYQIIEEINRRFIGYVKQASDHDDDLLNRVMIIKDDQVHMAHFAIVGSFSVNGVAKIAYSDFNGTRNERFSFLIPR